MGVASYYYYIITMIVIIITPDARRDWNAGTCTYKGSSELVLRGEKRIRNERERANILMYIRTVLRFFFEPVVAWCALSRQ